MRRLATTMLFVLAIACKKDDKRGNKPEPVRTLEITAFTPANGLPGTEVTITGKNFSTQPNGNRVTFNVTVADVISFSATQLKVKVPAGATTGKLKVTVGQQTGTSTTDFVVDQPGPAITDFTPKEGPWGTVVTITGKQFGNNPIVRVDNQVMPLISHSDTEIKFKTPSFAAPLSYKIAVEADNLSTQTATAFTVSSAGKMAEWVEKTINAAPGGIFINGTSFAYNNKLYWGFSKLTQGETKAGFMTCNPKAAAPQWIFDFLPDGMLGPDQTHATAKTYNGKVYIGSALGSNGVASGKWWRFNPDNNTAENLPDIPETTTFSLSFVLNNTLYAGFGSGSKSLYKFNANGAWDHILTGDFSEMSRANAVVIGNDVYIGRALMEVLGTRKALFRFTAPNQFVRMADMPDDLVGLSTPAFALNGKAYFLAGPRVWEYTPDAKGGTWRVVVEPANAPTMSFVEVVDGVPYGWTGSGRLFEFRFKP